MTQDLTAFVIEELKKGHRGSTPIIKAVRERFGLSLVDAKDLFVRCTEGKSLYEYQESLLPDLETALEKLDCEQ